MPSVLLIADPASNACLTAVQKVEEVIMRRVPRPFRKHMTEEDQIDLAAALLLAIETVIEHHPDVVGE